MQRIHINRLIEELYVYSLLRGEIFMDDFSIRKATLLEGIFNIILKNDFS